MHSRVIGAVAAVLAGTSPFGCGGSTQDAANSDATPEQLMDRYCASQCGDFASEAECQNALRESRAKAVATSCVDEFDASLRCVTSQDAFCTQQTADACAPSGRKLEDCRRANAAPDCSSDSTAQPDSNGLFACSYVCDTLFAADCTGPSLDGPFDCMCTMGPNAGTTFSVANCREAIITTTTAVCQ
jgi:hypothetical protein